MGTNEASLPQINQQAKEKNIVEIHNYPEKSIIEYSESEWSYIYDIIKEGHYPPIAYLKYTKGQNRVRISDCYEVKSSWGKPKKMQSIRCIIKYEEKNPVYWIYYGNEY